MNKALVALLAVACACPLAAAQAQEAWYPAAQVRGLLDARPSACAPTALEPDTRSSADCDLGADFSCGPLGAFCAVALGGSDASSAAQSVPTPINAGFRALGPAGSFGRVDGPGKLGNGSFRVVLNDPFEVSIEVQTGYIAGAVTLKRDPATGKDSMRFAGQRRADKCWTAPEDTTIDVVIRHDPKRDRGSISWKEADGSWKSEGFWGGGKDVKRMTIEFAGGWDHDFRRD